MVHVHRSQHGVSAKNTLRRTCALLLDRVPHPWRDRCRHLPTVSGQARAARGTGYRRHGTCRYPGGLVVGQLCFNFDPKYKE